MASKIELTSFPVLAMVGWALLFTYITLLGEFKEPDIQKFSRIYDVAFVIFPLVLALVVRPDIPRKILFGDSLTAEDSAGDGLTGLGVGLLITIFFLAPWGFTTITSALKLPFAVMASGQQFTQAVASQTEPMPQVFTVAVLNFFKVAFSEEFLMSVIRLTALGYFVKEYGHFQGLLATFGVTGLAFASLHYFAYAGLATSAYYAAFVGSLVFTFLFFWRGFYASVAAHGLYNTLLFVLTKAGVLDIFGTFASLSLVVAVVIVGLLFVNAQKKPVSMVG